MPENNVRPDSEAATSMAYGLTVLAQAKIREGESGSELLLQGLSLLPDSHREFQGSRARFSIVDTAVAEDKKIHSGPLNALKRLFGANASHPHIAQELNVLEQIDTDTSFTKLALEADLLMAAGRQNEAREKYTAALRSIRESGIQVME